ncbi:nuclear transport factor 2 family protein [Kitasatospora sp. NPDC094011]|uniref:nuclear transport factor 2 family protein n=1 Tax=Kitasatospora sp. NPDC094011 TaxID=3364090 RepID=UPI00382C38D1
MTSSPVDPADPEDPAVSAVPTDPADPADPDVALVLAAYAAYARGDIDAAVVDLDPDVDWVEPEEFPNGGPHPGRDAVHKYLSAAYAMWRELDSERSAYRRGEEIVVVHRMRGVLTDGVPLEITAADVYTVVEGRVVRMHAHADPAEVL